MGQLRSWTGHEHFVLKLWQHTQKMHSCHFLFLGPAHVVQYYLNWNGFFSNASHKALNLELIQSRVKIHFFITWFLTVLNLKLVTIYLMNQVGIVHLIFTDRYLLVLVILSVSRWACFLAKNNSMVHPKT